MKSYQFDRVEIIMPTADRSILHSRFALEGVLADIDWLLTVCSSLLLMLAINLKKKKKKICAGKGKAEHWTRLLSTPSNQTRQKTLGVTHDTIFQPTCHRCWCCAKAV